MTGQLGGEPRRRVHGVVREVVDAALSQLRDLRCVDVPVLDFPQFVTRWAVIDHEGRLWTHDAEEWARPRGTRSRSLCGG
jgi:hypothetical protein